MTIQNLFIADLGDIVRLQLECKCGARIGFTPEEAKLPHRCPQCQTGWRTEQTSFESELVENFMHSFKRIREQQKASAGSPKIGLVFDMGNQAK